MSASNTTQRGSCLCGSVSYTVSGPLRPICACHCKQCRKTSGHYVAATQCLQHDINIKEDALTWYQSSTEAERAFCGVCGSNLFWRRFNNRFISIFAGSLDSATDLRIESQIHTESKGDYYNLPDVDIIDQAILK